MFNKKYVKSEIKFSSEKINTNLIDHGMPKGGSHFVSLSVILIPFVFKTVKAIIHRNISKSRKTLS